MRSVSGAADGSGAYVVVPVSGTAWVCVLGWEMGACAASVLGFPSDDYVELLRIQEALMYEVTLTMGKSLNPFQSESFSTLAAAEATVRLMWHFTCANEYVWVKDLETGEDIPQDLPFKCPQVAPYVVTLSKVWPIRWWFDVRRKRRGVILSEDRTHERLLVARDWFHTLTDAEAAIRLLQIVARPNENIWLQDAATGKHIMEPVGGFLCSC